MRTVPIEEATGLAAAARNFFSRLLDALGATHDAAYRALPEIMREALTVGRPVDGGG